MTNYRWARNMLVVIGLVVATGCGPEESRVVVTYKQVANFRNYLLSADAGIDHHAGNGVYIMYKIKQIKNNGSAAVNFVFDVGKVSTLKDQIANDTVTDGNILLFGTNVTSVTVNAGQTKSLNGCFIKKALTPNPESLVMAQVPVIYESASDQPVSMDNLAPNGSVAAVIDALPSPLLSLCSSS